MGGARGLSRVAAVGMGCGASSDQSSGIASPGSVMKRSEERLALFSDYIFSQCWVAALDESE